MSFGDVNTTKGVIEGTAIVLTPHDTSRITAYRLYMSYDGTTIATGFEAPVGERVVTAGSLSNYYLEVDVRATEVDSTYIRDWTTTVVYTQSPSFAAASTFNYTNTTYNVTDNHSREVRNAVYLLALTSNGFGEMRTGPTVEVFDQWLVGMGKCPDPVTGVYAANCSVWQSGRWAENTTFADDVTFVEEGDVSRLNVFYDTTDLHQDVCNKSDGRDGKIGGEGFTFIVHNDPNGLDAHGCGAKGLGFAHNSDASCLDRIVNSVAIEFDSFFNVRTVKLQEDIHSIHASTLVEYDYQAVIAGFQDGLNNHTHEALGFFFTKSLPTNYLINDQRVHQATITYESTHVYKGEKWGSFHVGLDGIDRVMSFEVNMERVIDEDGKSYIGFTGSTGVGSEKIDLLSWRVCNGGPCVDKHVPPSLDRAKAAHDNKFHTHCP